MRGQLPTIGTMDAPGSSFDAEDALLATVAVLLVQEKAAKEQLLQRLLDAEVRTASQSTWSRLHCGPQRNALKSRLF